MSNLSIAADNTEYDDGDGGGEVEHPVCEDCGESEFALRVWNGCAVAVCTSCHAVQEGVAWFYSDGE